LTLQNGNYPDAPFNNFFVNASQDLALRHDGQGNMAVQIQKRLLSTC
jgi:hypothetical protein